MLTHLKDVLAGKHDLLVTRSSEWPKVRDEHLKIQPCCQVCGVTDKLNVHHIMPFHMDNSLELNPDNLITLCECLCHGVNCHLWFGHLGNFKKVNPSVVEDTKTWKDKYDKSNLDLNKL
jgi:hypothetical protein